MTIEVSLADASYIAVIIGVLSGIIFTGYQIRQSTKESEWNRLTEIHRRMQDLRDKIYRIEKDEISKEKMKIYVLNELEFYAYQVNNGKIKKTQELYNGLFLDFEEIYKEEIQDKTNEDYEEIRFLHEKLKPEFNLNRENL